MKYLNIFILEFVSHTVRYSPTRINKTIMASQVFYNLNLLLSYFDKVYFSPEKTSLISPSMKLFSKV